MREAERSRVRSGRAGGRACRREDHRRVEGRRDLEAERAGAARVPQGPERTGAGVVFAGWSHLEAGGAQLRAPAWRAGGAGGRRAFRGRVRETADVGGGGCARRRGRVVARKQVTVPGAVQGFGVSSSRFRGSWRHGDTFCCMVLVRAVSLAATNMYGAPHGRVRAEGHDGQLRARALVRASLRIQRRPSPESVCAPYKREAGCARRARA